MAVRGERDMNLLITNSRASYYVGGTEVVSLHQAIELARLGHVIDYVVRESTTPSEYFLDFQATIAREHLPVTIHSIAIDAPFGDGKSWIAWNQEALRFAIATLPLYLAKRPSIDLFVAHLVTDTIGFPLDAPFVLHLHGSPHRSDMLIDSAMGRVTRAIAHSDSIHAWWSEHYSLPSTYIFRNGVDSEVFSANVDTTRPIDVLYVGRFLEHKGILDILNAVSPSTRVVIAGSGPLEPEIRSIIRHRELSCASILRSPDNKTLAELYRSAKIFACPSRAKEGVLTTMLEAAASGCAIVTSRGSGMTDVAQDCVNSLLVDPGDAPGLATAFETLLSDALTRQAYAERFQDEVRTRWSWKRKGQELESIYQDIITHY